MNTINHLLDSYHAFAHTTLGLLSICSISSMFAIGFFLRCVTLSKKLIRPAIEQGFYNHILEVWLGPFFSKHKIIATFIKFQGLGDAVVDTIAYIIGTMFVVALLSSASTALMIKVLQNGFNYSLYIVFLVSSISMFTWVLGFNLHFFYKLANRLK